MPDVRTSSARAYARVHLQAMTTGWLKQPGTARAEIRFNIPVHAHAVNIAITAAPLCAAVAFDAFHRPLRLLGIE